MFFVRYNLDQYNKKTERQKVEGWYIKCHIGGGYAFMPSICPTALFGIKGDHYTEGLLTDYRLANNPLLYVS